MESEGPKGVINDWRRFKLDGVEQPPARRALLRQMSSNREEGLRKMGEQEYQLLQQDDEDSLSLYRRRCMLGMRERLSVGPTFDTVEELRGAEHFLEVVEKEKRSTLVVVHIYQHGVRGCEEMNSSLDCLAAEYPSVRFCRIDGMATGATEHFSSDVLPTLLVYKAGELLGNFLSVTQHLNQEFFATDVEALLNQYGLLPEKELTASPGEGEEQEEAQVE
ncbi:hypothetical protein CRUP_030608 [Coryphaenoides rupestris]|nr:hypothetical protein CRUP_030608 [Coryphaenoides rupestris]